MIQDVLDLPYWTLEPTGEFSAKSAWDYVRRRNEPFNAYIKIWAKGLPFKIHFFMWKVWRNKLPLDDLMRRLCYLMASRCWCCTNPMEETMHHLFFTSYVARRVWPYFLSSAGIVIDGLTFHQIIIKCWTAKVIPRLQPIIQEITTIIVWELWKRRNNFKHGDSVIVSRVIYQVSSTLQSLVKFRKPRLIHVPYK